jgi:hypothetical protein
MHILIPFAFTATVFVLAFYKTRSLLTLLIPAGYLVGFFL